MNINTNNPIIVQSDKTLLVEVNNELYTEVRDKLSRFAEVIKSPEYIHTYKISPYLCGMQLQVGWATKI